MACGKLKNGVVGAPPPARLLVGAFEASKDLWQVVSHGAKGFSFDAAAQRNAMYGGLVLLGFLVLFVPYNRRTRRMAEKLLTTETRMHGEGIWGLREILRGQGRARLRSAFSPSARRGMGHQGCDLGMAPPSILSSLTKPHYYSVPPRLCGESSSRPLAPWTPGPFRFAARLLMLVMLFQGAIFFMPVQTQAQVGPCEETFYPLADSLGSVNMLTDSTGSVVLTQHFLPFGEDFETPKPPVTNCNNGDPWPYGFTGQYHDAETSLIYFHARYYNPATGHFMSADSVVPNPNDTYSYDRYAYCRNNPVNLTDPTGHIYWLAALAIAALITAGATFVSTLVSGGTVGEAFENAAIAGGSVFLFGVYAGPVVSAVIQASMHGGNLLQAALIAGISMAIGMGVGNAIAASVPAAYQGVVNVLASGMVGGAISSAMGGDFWQGFTSAAVAAGVNLAANEVAGEIEGASQEGTTSGGPEAGNEGGSEVPLGQIQAKDSVLIVQLPDSPDYPAKSSSGDIVDPLPLKHVALTLQDHLTQRGADVVLWDSARTGQEVNDVLNFVRGDYDHVIVLGHNYQQGLYMGEGRGYWTQAQVTTLGQGGSVANKSFTWATCNAGRWGYSNYLAGPQLAPTVTASPRYVNFNIATHPVYYGPPSLSGSVTSSLWWWRMP